MNSLLSFMAPEATALDTAVAEFVSRLPKGDGHVGCNYLCYAFERTHWWVSLEDFEAAASRVTQTSAIYGRQFIEGVDPEGVRAMYLECFA